MLKNTFKFQNILNFWYYNLFDFIIFKVKEGNSSFREIWEGLKKEKAYFKGLGPTLLSIAPLVGT